ncbi:dTDP-4-dehydrorhamnose 3,5-epimerase [Candidatus Binatia bacterium]|nr:dTDP-4-dehydrorhamnose 3,5-epimerase [Candidatus Binatia bacterium]
MLRPASALPGLVVFTARHFHDNRGFLLQSWVAEDLEALGVPSVFKQAIQTYSKRGVVRGLHFQWNPPMGKLVRCIAGGVIDVVVDVRHGSPTCGDHAAVELTGSNHRVVWVPPGFAHGTFALADDTIVIYECTAPHGPGGEGGIRWNDPALAIDWPRDIPPIVSEKDEQAPALAEWLADPQSQQFRFS